MSTPRLVQAPISICFSEAALDKEVYEREYQQLSESDEDPISQWLKLAKAKGDTRETDPILLELVVELHRKIDSLEMPIYPKHDVGVFFEAQSTTLAKIIKMHDRDEKEWNAYMTARERILIREAREKK